MASKQRLKTVTLRHLPVKLQSYYRLTPNGNNKLLLVDAVGVVYGLTMPLCSGIFKCSGNKWQSGQINGKYILTKVNN